YEARMIFNHFVGFQAFKQNGAILTFFLFWLMRGILITNTRQKAPKGRRIILFDGATHQCHTSFFRRPFGTFLLCLVSRRGCAARHLCL
ncbi:MAG: hypothetical protein II661_04165, partial [Bacteroidales bacterium]|nr:hypothetical protein [Bacteroidales bacterium]